MRKGPDQDQASLVRNLWQRPARIHRSASLLAITDATPETDGRGVGGPSICPTTPHPITGESVPLTFGHEFSGVIEELGEGVTKFSVGDRVCVQPIIYDGTCGACQDGLINCCYQNGFMGLSGQCQAL